MHVITHRSNVISLLTRLRMTKLLVSIGILQNPTQYEQVWRILIFPLINKRTWMGMPLFS
jgi:hypothetical protein